MSAIDGDSSILVVFCRRPVSGHGKRRIAAELGDELTLTLSRHLLAAALEDAMAWPGTVVIAPSDTSDAEWAARQLERRCRVVPQSGGNLGERINRIDRTLRANGDERVVLIGSDAPVLTTDNYRQVIHELDHHDVVLGPADDGGVTLMANRRPWPELGHLPWSTSQLGGALERSCRECGHSVYRLAPRYDIDRYTDLRRLMCDLMDDARPARRALQAWLTETGLPDDER